MKTLKLGALAMWFVSLFICSCGNDDEPNNGNNWGDNPPTSAYVEYRLKLSGDVMQLSEVKVFSTNPDGSLDSVVLNKDQYEWIRKIKVDIPFSGKLYPKFRVKENIPLIKDVYPIGISGYCKYQYEDFESEDITDKIPTYDLKPNTVMDYLKEYYKEWKIEVPAIPKQ